MEKPNAATGDWALIESLLPRNWREIAERNGLRTDRVPPQLGAKVRDIAVPLRMILHRVATDNALKTTAASGYAGDLIDISGPALHGWERKMGPFLADLVAEMSDAQRLFATERWAGYDIIVEDATSVCRPGSMGTTAKVHYALRLATLRDVGIEVTDDRGGESFRRFDARPGELWLGDRVYANPPGIASRTAEGADVLVRYNRGALPLYDAGGRRLDVRAKLRKLRRAGSAREWAAWVHAESCAPIRGRLVAVRLPGDKAAEARERLRREQGDEVTAESLEMAAFVVVFTTAPADRLPAARVLELYSLRWQVELFIKREKSIAGLDRLPNRRADTIYTWLCAKLLLAQIARKMATADVSIPPSDLGAALSLLPPAA